jgi:hypothetical protein
MRSSVFIHSVTRKQFVLASQSSTGWYFVSLRDLLKSLQNFLSKDCEVNDHEIEFHEIKSSFFQEIKSFYNTVFDNFDQEVERTIMRSKVKNTKITLLLTFDLMNNLLATSAIMRSKVFMHWWQIIRAKN